jgi:hypothetical protein
MSLRTEMRTDTRLGERTGKIACLIDRAQFLRAIRLTHTRHKTIDTNTKCVQQKLLDKCHEYGNMNESLFSLIMFMVSDHVSELRPPTRLFVVHPTLDSLYEYGEAGWNDTGRGKQKVSDKDLCHFVRHISHMD